MKLLSHFPAIGVSNTYIIGSAEGGDAILVDPGRFDVTLLNLIEDNNFDIKTVLVTHDHENHIKGLKTLMKIYNPAVIAGSGEIFDIPTKRVEDGESIICSGFPVEVIEVEGHSSDSRVYRIASYIFTGDVLSAGRIGSSSTSYTRELLLQSIKTKIMCLNEDLLVLPGHGPPTSISAEKRWNPDLRTIQ
ncbi:MAG: MBL fold metallo-hydrolase [Spirochaetaceae bacterium]|nr:MBL fold metallo-hydrolase [Spirochaetaceae bacterium]